MRDEPLTGVTEPPPALAALWDQLCDQFEADWKLGREPRIENALDAMPEPGRRALFHDLIELDLAYRNAAGTRLSREEYLARFPDYADLVRDAFEATLLTHDPIRDAAVATHAAGLGLLSGTASQWLDVIGEGILTALRRDAVEADHLKLPRTASAARATSVGPDVPDERGTTAGAVPTGDTQPTRRFQFLRPHAQGGLGVVSVARDEDLSREVAFKQILDRSANDPVSRARFLAEAVITGNLEHPGVVPVYALGWYDGRPYYAMRLVRGESLQEALDRFHAGGALAEDPGGRSLAARKFLGRFLTVCDAVSYAHDQRILHRDLKPANIMLGAYGETFVVDWGLALPIDGEAPGGAVVRSAVTGGTATGSIVGTPAFMSPERAIAEPGRVGPRSDIYSLGAILYCILTGRPPFVGDPAEVLEAVQKGEFPRPRTLNASVDPALEAICLKAMAQEPDDRYRTARALADDIERWAADEPVAAWREPLSRRARRWARRNRAAVAAAAAGFLAAVIGLSAVAVVQAKSNAALARANSDTRTALAETRMAQQETAAALVQSEESRKQAEAVGNFLIDALRRPEPSADGRDVKVADVLDKAAAGLDHGFKGSKETAGALFDALGRSYRGLGLYPQAEAMHRRARAVLESTPGPTHGDTLGGTSPRADSL
jgi:hypothetical protein